MKTIEGDGFTITAPTKTVEGKIDRVEVEIVLPKREPITELDEVIRAFQEGDGATMHEHRGDVVRLLCELRGYRAIIRCPVCKRTVLGRDPICGECHEDGTKRAQAASQHKGSGHE
jgi:hypothetical protein